MEMEKRRVTARGMMKKETQISIIVPAFNEAENVAFLAERIVAVLPKEINYEILFIDDGSTDETLSVLKNLHGQNKQIRYLSFSRNFGHQNALRAGLNEALGDAVISLDADLQHPPELIPTLIQYWQEGYDVVYTVRLENQNQSWFKRKTSALYYRVLGFITGICVPKGAADFRLLDRKVVNVIKNSPERELFLRGYISWLGFKQIGVPYEVGKRYAGKSSYTLMRMIKLAWAGITSFGIMPLRLASIIGLCTTCIGFLYAGYILYMKLFTDSFVVAGWASVLVSVLILGGVQLLIIGILGEYLGLVYLESKHRPAYIIKEKSEND